jgi:hypothetical protein
MFSRFFFPFSFVICGEREKNNKKKDLEDKPKLRLQYHMYCHININKTNLTISRKITNHNSSGYIYHLNIANGSFTFVDMCETFKSSLVFFFGIIRFMLLKYFLK